VSRNITPRYKDGWRVVGPGGGGAQFEPSISPHDDRDMFICCDMSSHYLSRDAGESFRQMNFGFLVCEVSFHPTDPNVCYGCSTGLYKSTDAGHTWKLLFPKREDVTKEFRDISHDEGVHQFRGKNWPGGWFEKLGIDQDNPNIMIVGSVQNAFGGCETNGLTFYISRDGGESWEEILPNLPGEFVRTICMYKGCAYVVTSQTVAVYDYNTGTQSAIKLPAGVIGIHNARGGKMSDGRLVLYIDGLHPGIKDEHTPHWFSEMENVQLYAFENKTWRKCDVGFVTPRQAVPNGAHIACCANKAEHLYYSVYRYKPYDEAGRCEGVMRSDDAGRTWRWVMGVTDDFPDNLEQHWLDKHYGPIWAEPPIGVAVSPNNPNVCVYTTFGTTHRTDNGGKYWRSLCGALTPEGGSVTRGLDVTTCYGYHTNPFNIKERIISYTDIGMCRSEDGGNSWFPAVTGVPHKWINTAYWTVYDPEIPDKVYSCWSSHHDLPLRKMFFYRDWFIENHGGVCVSEDGGRNWRPTLMGMTTADIILDPRSPKDARVLYAAMTGEGVYKSVDGGETWTLKNNGLPDKNYAYQITQAENGTLYLACVRALDQDKKTIPGAVYVSYDGAETWEIRNMPAGETGMGDIAVDIHRLGGLYIVCRPGWNPDEGNGGIFYSTDDAKTWTKLPLEVMSGYTHNIAQDPAVPGRLFCSTFAAALFRSDDYGQTWHRLGGFNFRAAHRPTPDPENPDMIYVPCFGSSVWHGPVMGNGNETEDIVG